MHGAAGAEMCPRPGRIYNAGMRFRRLGSMWLVVVLGAIGSARAVAADTDGWLAWSSSSQACGDGGAFAARVERALGRSPALAAAGARVNVTARVAAATAAGAPRWVGEVQLRGDDQRDLGSRTIDRRDPSCQPLIEAMAVVTALALADDGIANPPPASTERVAEDGPLAGATTLPEPPAPAVVSSPEPTNDRAPAARVVPAEAPTPPQASHPSAEPLASLSGAPSPPRTSSSRRWRSGIDGGAKVGVGLLPQVAFGAEVSAYLRTAGGWKFFLAFGGWQRQSSLDGLGRGASFQRLEVGLGLCPFTLARGAWDGAACLDGNLGRMTISGVGFEMGSTQDRLVLDAGVGGALSRRLIGPLAAGLTVAVTTPLIRDRIGYGLTGGGVVSIFQESVVAVVGGLRLSVVF